MSWTIRLLGLVSGRESPHDGQYIVLYDPTPIAKGEEPILITTPHETHARRFPDSSSAFAYYRLESGLPYPRNRPLTAYTLEMKQI